MACSGPPASLQGFPGTELAAGAAMYRIVAARDPHTGRRRTPWFFSSLPGRRRGRFDVPAPDGSCYFSDYRYGAWFEVFRRCGLVDRVDVEARRLYTVVRSGPSLRLADLRAPGARRFGVTADLAGGADYALAHRWAAAVHAAGFPGLVATVRHDPTHTARNVVVFGRAGSRSRVNGWRGRVSSLVGDPVLPGELAPFGTGVTTVPTDVTVTAVP